MPEFIVPTTKEEWEKSGSKFASEGMHLSEAGMPVIMEKAIKFPFVIIEDGDDKDKAGEVVASFRKFSLEPVLKALDVPLNFTDDGKPTFDTSLVPGKQFLSVWTEAVDSRSPEEGGKGTKYTKPTGALPVGSKTESLLE